MYDKLLTLPVRSSSVNAATLTHVTDLGFLWFREFYMETAKVIQVYFLDCFSHSSVLDRLVGFIA